MKVAGIVAEYNPFHNGHAHQVERTRAPEGGEASHVVAVMSGSFVQRGEPALLPKADRVRAALAGGVDLVLELPLPWALSSAEGFALRGSVGAGGAGMCGPAQLRQRVRRGGAAGKGGIRHGGPSFLIPSALSPGLRIPFLRQGGKRWRSWRGAGQPPC